MQINQKICFHCGGDIEQNVKITTNDKDFCCLGCKTIYEIFSQNNLEKYYTLEKSPGIRPDSDTENFDFLDNQKIVENLLEFNDEKTQIVQFYIPNIHCSSCIWVLENLHKLNKNVIHSLVNFPKKSVRITFNGEKLSLKELALLLSYIGYPPYISLDDYKNKKIKKQDRALFYKMGMAAFAFGSVMQLSVPEYFGNYDVWLNQYKYLFRWMSLVLSFFVMVYSASDYFVSAYKGLRSRVLNIDIPLALGIFAMFVRSLYDVVFDLGQGFFDSLNGLVFFLLIGKFFQQKTYNFLSFERDYKSYFPIGVTKLLGNNKEESIQIYDIKQGDRLLIRNSELIPADSILVKGTAHIDYSFVTGETLTAQKQSGDKLFAGGRQKGEAIEIECVKEVSQSYLTQLWSQDIFSKNKFEGVKTLTDKISKYFTIIILAISFLAVGYWWGVKGEAHTAFNVFTAVLIIACPCALAMSAPFTLGNMLRIFGRKKFYLKDTRVIEQLAKIDTIIFDKTGTITSSKESKIIFEGDEFSPQQKLLLKNALRNSNHPLSRQLYGLFQDEAFITLTSFSEEAGQGILAHYAQDWIKIGSKAFVGILGDENTLKTSVYICFNDQKKGKFTFENAYRKGIKELFNQLSKRYVLAILSGDNASERQTLEEMLPKQTSMYFNQKPEDKLNKIKQYQQDSKMVLMAGDGLNDAGALKQSDVGVSISENINVFSPACDAILDASKLKDLDRFIKLSRDAIKVVKFSFVISLMYNVIGVSLAISDRLSPVAAAILMPLSSISIVLFTTITTNIISKRSLK